MNTLKNSGLAIVLSFFLPGLGQLYAGHIARGLAMVFTTLFLGTTHLSLLTHDIIRHATPTIVAAGLVLAVLSSLYWMWATIDAYNVCAHYNSTSIIQTLLPTVNIKISTPNTIR